MGEREDQGEDLDYLPIFGGFLSFSDSKRHQSPIDYFGQDLFNFAINPMRDVPSVPLSLRDVGLGLAGAAAILASPTSRTARVPVRTLPIVGTIAVGSAAWPHLRGFFRRSQTRQEASREDLLEHASSLTKQRRVLALEEFRERLAAGEFEVAEREPDGTMRKLSANELRAFAADFGRNLIVSSEPDKREIVRSNLRPIGELVRRQNIWHRLSAVRLEDWPRLLVLV